MTSNKLKVSADKFTGSEIFRLTFKDIDGNNNGSYQETDSLIDFSDVEFTNGDGWYSGEKSKEINIELNSDEE